MVNESQIVAPPLTSDTIHNGSPQVLPESRSQAPSGSDVATAGKTAQGTEAPSWRKPGLEKFQNEEALASAYLELQRAHSQGSNELHRYKTFAEEIAPYMPYIERMAAEEEASAQRGGKGRNAENGQDEVYQQLLNEVKGMKQGLQGSSQAVQQMAMDSAATRFKSDFPDAEAIKTEIGAIIAADPPIVAISDYNNPTIMYNALKAAYSLVKASKAEKQNAGAAAARVAGGSGGPGTPGFDPFDPKVTAGDILDRINKLQS